jgi:hypothetical protein
VFGWPITSSSIFLRGARSSLAGRLIGYRTDGFLNNSTGMYCTSTNAVRTKARHPVPAARPPARPRRQNLHRSSIIMAVRARRPIQWRCRQDDKDGRSQKSRAKAWGRREKGKAQRLPAATRTRMRSARRIDDSADRRLVQFLSSLLLLFLTSGKQPKHLNQCYQAYLPRGVC